MNRPPKAVLDPLRAYGSVWEEEPDASGTLVPTAVVFLTNRECPFRCVFCDLWVNTTDETVPRGAIAAQIRQAVAGLPPARAIKLYNAGSFFDPQAIPPEDDEEIAEAVAAFDRVIVEAHPAFLAGAWGDRCLRFRDRLRGRLEVAIGLETANPDVLALLNKRMTLDSFQQAARFLAANDIDLRVFILLNPPFLDRDDAVDWACRSIDFALECGAGVCSVIPVRGAKPPSDARDLERVVEYGISRGRCRVFADVWDMDTPRLRELNRTQHV